MEKFLDDYKVSKTFYSDEEFRILNIGYNDFSEIEGIHFFHQQRVYTLHFVLSGRGQLDIYGKTYYLGEGDMFFIPPNTPMRYFPNEDDPWEYVWFSFAGEKILYYAKMLGFDDGQPIMKSGSFPRIRNVLQNLFARVQNGECGYYGVFSYFYKIIDICADSSERAEIQKVREIIDNSFSLSSFRIEELCTTVGISHSHLLRLFKDAYGLTPIAYLTQRRMAHARELLSETALSVASVAYSCGFDDEFHFMKCFKRDTGMTALAYRKAYGKTVK